VAIYAETIQQLGAQLANRLPGGAAKSCLSEVQAGLASTLHATGRCAEALAAWDQAIKLDAGENHDGFLAQRAVSLASLGDHTGAAATAQAATARKPAISMVWYDAARALAQCCPAALQDARLSTSRRLELADQYARQALHVLRLAAADRMFTDFQITLGHLETDRDLDPLRSRPDFQSLVAEQRAEAQRVRTVPDR
jgi:tetratricopeptide (TPR) repeat protein